MRIDRRLFIGGIVALVAGSGAACASRTGGTTASAARNLVSQEELAETNARYVYQALERVRPSWLSSRGPAGMSNVRETSEAVASVYINGSRMGDIEFLRQYAVRDAQEVRFYEPGEASARFGMGNPRGVIEVIPRR
ncbi:MAG TPA: TonB-dependent receptor plug domain-containing protein [Longimicrobiales bacterium]|nr:TonB-dependent receptor plug domain-containing protein [Longimicrobiales bacterium]